MLEVDVPDPHRLLQRGEGPGLLSEGVVVAEVDLVDGALGLDDLEHRGAAGALVVVEGGIEHLVGAFAEAARVERGLVDGGLVADEELADLDLDAELDGLDLGLGLGLAGEGGVELAAVDLGEGMGTFTVATSAS
jgi:hypothetical protein